MRTIPDSCASINGTSSPPVKLNSWASLAVTNCDSAARLFPP